MLKSLTFSTLAGSKYMIGILVLLALSWLILYYVEKENLSVLGVYPTKKRVVHFFAAFLVTSLLCFATQYIELILTDSEWFINDSIAGVTIVKGFFWDIKSVLTEELLFRGALLYILIQKIGEQKSILISACSFGIYHWFSFGVFGNTFAMLLIFIGTGLMGYAFALSFSKSKSLLLPIALHLGWNFTYNTVFSNGPLGELILISRGGVELTGLTSLFNFANGLIIAPIIVLLYVWLFIPNTTIEASMAED